MKKIYSCILALSALVLIWGCKKDNYPGGEVSPYIAILDVRNIYKGSDVTLTTENMFGAHTIQAVVVSDHSGGNMPSGLLVVQDNRRLNMLRGIAISLGGAASTYMPGDEVSIKIDGATLTRQNGVLMLTGIGEDRITKLGTVALTPNVVKSNSVIDNPEAYEGTLISITKAGFDPNLPPGSTFAGDRLINDGFGNLVLHTEAGATFAGNTLPFLSNFTGIVFRTENNEAQLWPRVDPDITILSATAPKISPALITGFLVDPTGTDANYEYIQLIATRDIDFSLNPISVVTCNNAGTAAPTGFPANGWATGTQRTYKFDLTSGTVSKGEYFYVGANKNIWGAGSTDISSSKWFGKMYATLGGDGFGQSTTNLLANSGNGAGIAVFDHNNVTDQSEPVDVIFYGGAGQLYTAGPPERGYRITNTDYYDLKNPTTLADQPFYSMGTNTGKFAFPPATNFVRLGGTYNKTTGRWTSARIQANTVLTATSTVSDIEGGTTIEE